MSGPPLANGFRRAMWICAALCASGSLVAWFTVGTGEPPRTVESFT
jgi:hypothetical protein